MFENSKEVYFFGKQEAIDYVRQVKPRARDLTDNEIVIHYLVEYTRTVRQFMLTLGDHLRRINPYVFVNALFADTNVQKASGLIIPDVRRINEYQAVRNRGGILVRIIRDNNPFVEPATLHHPTEVELVDYPFDYIIRNNGSLEELAEQARKIMETIKSK